MADGKNKSKNTSSSFDEIFGWKDGVNSPSGGRSSGSSSGYFSNVFPPASSGMTGDSRNSDLYWTLNKHKADGQVGHGQGSKSQGSPTKNTQHMTRKGNHPTMNQWSPPTLVRLCITASVTSTPVPLERNPQRIPKNTTATNVMNMAILMLLPEANGGKVRFTTEEADKIIMLSF